MTTTARSYPDTHGTPARSSTVTAVSPQRNPDLPIAVLTNPRSLARNRTHVSLITEAARRAGAYLAEGRERSIAPLADAVTALDAFRRPLQDHPVDAHEVLAELDRLGSPATTIQGQGRYFGFVNGGLDPTAHAAGILAGTWDQNLGVFAMSPAGTVLDEVAGTWVVEALGLPA